MGWWGIYVPGKFLIHKDLWQEDCAPDCTEYSCRSWPPGWSGWRRLASWWPPPSPHSLVLLVWLRSSLLHQTVPQEQSPDQDTQMQWNLQWTLHPCQQYLNRVKHCYVWHVVHVGHVWPAHLWGSHLLPSTPSTDHGAHLTCNNPAN